MKSFERVIIKNLIENIEFSKIVSPYLKDNYFEDYYSKIFVRLYMKYISKYNNIPTFDNIYFIVSKMTKISSIDKEKIIKELRKIQKEDFKTSSIKWLKDETLTYFRRVQIKTAIYKASEWLQEEDNKGKEENLMPMIKDALKFDFDNGYEISFGTEKYVKTQHNYYHKHITQYPTEWKRFNKKVLYGGFKKRALHMIYGGTGVGKTTIFCNFAKQFHKIGLNVLFITLEQDEHEICERIDQNITGCRREDLKHYSESKYGKMILDYQRQTGGTMVVKHMPSTVTNVNHLKYALDDARLKYEVNFDVIIVDYLTLMSSVRNFKQSDSYNYFKGIVEELRNFCYEENLIGISGGQLNRQGISSNDPVLKDLADSIGMAFGADLIMILSQSKDFRDENKYLLKQVKSRYGHIDDSNENIVMNVDKTIQRIYEKEMDDNFKDKNNDELDDFMKNYDCVGNKNIGLSDTNSSEYDGFKDMKF